MSQHESCSCHEKCKALNPDSTTKDRGVVSMCLAILAGTCKATQAVHAVNTIDPPLLNSVLVIAAPSPSITGLAQPVALASSQDLTVTTLSNH
jgi:hypothetical protein